MPTLDQLAKWGDMVDVLRAVATIPERTPLLNVIQNKWSAIHLLVAISEACSVPECPSPLQNIVQWTEKVTGKARTRCQHHYEDRSDATRSPERD